MQPLIISLTEFQAGILAEQSEAAEQLYADSFQLKTTNHLFTPSYPIQNWLLNNQKLLKKQPAIEWQFQAVSLMNKQKLLNNKQSRN
jgi:hypothetical protein